MNTYQWRCLELQTQNQPYAQTVCSVLILLTVQDPTGSHTVETRLVRDLNTDNIPNFVNYADLTEDLVIQWVKSSYSVTEFAQLLTAMDQQLAQAISSPQTSGLPWHSAQSIHDQWVTEQAARSN